MFSPAISFVITCETQQEVDRFWNTLVADGGKPNQCGWLEDKYGLSWQVVPATLSRLLQEKDTRVSQRVMQAMLQMTKIDTARLQAAASSV